MLSSVLEEMLKQFSSTLNSAAFCDEHRRKPSDFTRKRCLTFGRLVVFLLQHIGGRSLQEGLDSFFMVLCCQADCVRQVTKSALSQARKKLKASAFVALNRVWVKNWHEHVIFEDWHRYRVLAADGSCIRVPRWLENIEAYGIGPCGDGSVPMARCVGRYSVASKQWLEVVVGRYDQGERELLLTALDQVAPNDILVLDRGYPAGWLFAVLLGRGITFCARIEGQNWKAVKNLLRSDQQQVVLQHKLKAHDQAKLRQYGLPVVQYVVLRLIKLRLPTGKWEVLVTSLTDMQDYPAADFSQLYQKRWAVEEGFKLVKQHQQLEGFSGELPESIEQEIQAKIMLHNIVQAVCHKAQQDLPPEKQNWQVNRVYALKQVPRIIIASLKASHQALQHTIQTVTSVLSRTLELIRPNRSFPRKHAIGGAQRPRKSYR